MTKTTVTKKVTSIEYPQAFLSCLDNAKDVWEFAFNKHITTYAKYILYLLLTFDKDVTVKEMEIGVKSLLSFIGEDISFFNNKYREALSELQNTFIKILPRQNSLVISFENHSIRDYLIYKIKLDTDIINLLIKSAAYKETQFYFLKGYTSPPKKGFNINKNKFNDFSEPIQLEDEAKSILEDTLVRNYKSLKKLSNSSMTNVKQIGMIYHMDDFKDRQSIRIMLRNFIQEEQADDSISYNGYITAVRDLISLQDTNIAKVLDNVYKGVQDLIDLGEFLSLSSIVPNQMKVFIKQMNLEKIEDIKSLIVHNVGEELYDPIYENYIPIIKSLELIEEVLAIITTPYRLELASEYFLNQINKTDEVSINFNDFTIDEMLFSAIEHSINYHAEEILSVREVFPEEFCSFCKSKKLELFNYFVNCVIYKSYEYVELIKIASEYGFSNFEFDNIWRSGCEKKDMQVNKLDINKLSEIETLAIPFQEKSSEETNLDSFMDFSMDLNESVQSSKENQYIIERMFNSLIINKFEF